MLAANISSQITPTISEAILAGVAEGSLRPVVGREMRLAMPWDCRSAHQRRGRRDELLEERRPLMQAWTDFATAQQQPNTSPLPYSGS